MGSGVEGGELSFLLKDSQKWVSRHPQFTAAGAEIQGCAEHTCQVQKSGSSWAKCVVLAPSR